MLVPGSVPVSSKNSGPTGQRSQLTSLELVMPKHYVVVEDGKDQALLGQTGLVTREIVPCLFFFIPCRPCTTERLENETTQQKPSIRLERSLWKSLNTTPHFQRNISPRLKSLLKKLLHINPAGKPSGIIGGVFFYKLDSPGWKSH